MSAPITRGKDCNAASAKQTTSPPTASTIPTIVEARKELWCDIIPPNTKMMEGTISALTPLPSAGVNKLTYDTHPHIIEHLMRYCSASVLLAFRATCRRLCARADRLFGSHVELSQDGLHLVFETPGNRVIKGQKIPAWCFRPKDIRYFINLSIDNVAILAEDPVNLKFDHRVTCFTVHHKHAKWFAEFLKGVECLDMHGGSLLTIFPGLQRSSVPDALGNITMDAVKIPTLRFFGCGGDEGQYASAIPFRADTVEYHGNVHLAGVGVKGSWFFWPKWIPECRNVVHQVYFNVNQRFGPPELMNTVRPFLYPPTVKTVTVVLCVTGPVDITMTRMPIKSHADPGLLSKVTLLSTFHRACGAFTTSIKWVFVGLRAIKVHDGTHIVEPDLVPELVLRFLALCKAAKEGKSLSQDELHRQIEEISPQVEICD